MLSLSHTITHMYSTQVFMLGLTQMYEKRNLVSSISSILLSSIQVKSSGLRRTASFGCMASPCDVKP